MSSSTAELLSRPPRPDEAEAVARLLTELDAHFGFDAPTRGEDVAREWRELDLACDAWVWEREGRLAAYGSVYTRGERTIADGYVRPGDHGCGLGAAIVDATERRARERGATELENGVLENDERANALLRSRGYTAVRSFRRMGIDLDREPPAPSFPEELEAAAFDPSREAREFHAALEEAFADEWGHEPESFEDWSKRRIDTPDFEPALCSVVRAEGEVVAVVLADWKRHGDYGWIGALGVRKPWRRRGLGEALLLRTFREFRSRGERVVQLGVDSQNPTGAGRLYERVGMRQVFGAVAYVKVLG